MPRWKSYSIPEELETRIKLIVKARPDLYTSVADFIRDACDDKVKGEEERLEQLAGRSSAEKRLQQKEAAVRKER